MPSLAFRDKNRPEKDCLRSPKGAARACDPPRIALAWICPREWALRSLCSAGARIWEPWQRGFPGCDAWRAIIAETWPRSARTNSIGAIDFDNRLARGTLRAATAKKEHGSLRVSSARKPPWLFRRNDRKLELKPQGKLNVP